MLKVACFLLLRGSERFVTGEVDLSAKANFITSALALCAHETEECGLSRELQHNFIADKAVVRCGTVKYKLYNLVYTDEG